MICLFHLHFFVGDTALALLFVLFEDVPASTEYWFRYIILID